MHSHDRHLLIKPRSNGPPDDTSASRVSAQDFVQLLPNLRRLSVTWVAPASRRITSGGARDHQLRRKRLSSRQSGSRPSQLVEVRLRMRDREDDRLKEIVKFLEHSTLRTFQLSVRGWGLLDDSTRDTSLSTIIGICDECRALDFEEASLEIDLIARRRVRAIDTIVSQTLLVMAL
jgi:hypothetical protein